MVYIYIMYLKLWLGSGMKIHFYLIIMTLLNVVCAVRLNAVDMYYFECIVYMIYN
jgi:hypothetical protein